MSNTTFARAVCNACDPGTSKKPFVVTVYTPDRREYVYFQQRAAASKFEGLVAECQNQGDLDYLLRFYK